RRAVSARRLAMGAKRRRDGYARLDARARLPAVSVARLRRGANSLHFRDGFADLPPPDRELCRLGSQLLLSEVLRLRVPLRRAAVQSPDVPPLGRLSRHPGSFSARPRPRLLRE